MRISNLQETVIMKTLLKNCDIVASSDTGFNVIKNGFLGIADDRICYLGNAQPIEKYDLIKDMDGKVLFPGLINTHCHSAMTLLRGIGSDLPLKEWLYDHMFPTEDKLRSSDVRAGSQLAIMEMLSTGTTSFSDMYYFCEDTADAVLSSGIKANLCRAISAFDPAEAYEDSYRVKEAIELYKNYHNAGSGRLKIDFSIHAEYTCLEHIVKAHSQTCRQMDGIMHIHLSETKSEHESCLKKYGKTPAEWFRDLGTFESPCLAAHCVWCTDSDLDILRKYNVAPIHNPTSNMKLGSGFAPIQKMSDLGLTIGIGTDGAASNNNLNLIEELHIASIIHNGFHNDPVIMKPAEVLKMATLNGAKIQGRPDCGSIAVGNKADIIALDFNAPHMLPAFDPISMLCYSVQGSDVAMTMVDGKILYENGEFLTIDREKVFADVKQSLKHLYC